MVITGITCGSLWVPWFRAQTFLKVPLPVAAASVQKRRAQQWHRLSGTMTRVLPMANRQCNQDYIWTLGDAVGGRLKYFEMKDPQVTMGFNMLQVSCFDLDEGRYRHRTFPCGC